jgi:cytochrome P450
MVNEPTNRPRVHFDRHAPSYRADADAITHELHSKCPVAWTDTYGGHWVVGGHAQVFDLARRADILSNRHDVDDPESPFRGTGIPENFVHVGFLETDPPQHRDYRDALNPYLSPAAIQRWMPMAEDLTAACLDDVIESGSLDFVDDLANVVPAVLTMALMGLPLADWHIYSEPIHEQFYTPPDSPDREAMMQRTMEMLGRLFAAIGETRSDPRPGLIDALVRTRVGDTELTDTEILSSLMLLISGGLDTTTALTANALEWLAQHPDERARLCEDDSKLINTATEEFLRYFAPVPGDARTLTEDCEFAGQALHRGDRLWLSWSMANRDPEVFLDPDLLDIGRPRNRHTSFGLGLHRCIGSNLARMVFKVMLRQVLERVPDYVCDFDRAVHYETIGIINGMQHLPATFPPGHRLGAGVAEAVAGWQQHCDDIHLGRFAPASAG